MNEMPKCGSWSVPGQTQTAGTVIKIPIPPYPGQTAGGLPLLYQVNSQGKPNWYGQNGAFTHVTNYGINCSSTQHIAYFMRPFNWSLVTVAGAANGTTFTIGTDPGLYTTAANWKWPGTTPKNVATNAIEANDYFAVQLSDGTWFFDKVSSVTSLAITTTTTIPNITGGGIPVGNVMFFFGIQTDTDPRTGMGHPSFQSPISAFTQHGDMQGSLVTTLGQGEPIYYFNANATGADVVSNIGGFYARF